LPWYRLSREALTIEESLYAYQNKKAGIGFLDIELADVPV